LLAPTFHTFQAHFENCSKCRRLMAGIEDAIDICREIKETEVETPPSLQDRILAATVGPRKTSWIERMKDSAVVFSRNAARVMMTAEMAAAMLIFAASSLLVLSRFGSFEGMASYTTKQAGQFMAQGQRAFNTVQFGLTGETRHTSKPNEPATPSGQPVQIQPTPELNAQPENLDEPKAENQPHHLRHRRK